MDITTVQTLRAFPEIGTLCRKGSTLYYTFLPNGDGKSVYVEHINIEELTAYLIGIQIRPLI